MSEVEIVDGDVVIFQGRRYRFVSGPLNCTSQGHAHWEEHEPGKGPAETTLRHHHHSQRCEDIPRQATLYPTWEPETRHKHDFVDSGPVRQEGTCSCGASREVQVQVGGRKYQVRYVNPPDAEHPDGWSCVRVEELDV